MGDLGSSPSVLSSFFAFLSVLFMGAFVMRLYEEVYMTGRQEMSGSGMPIESWANVVGLGFVDTF